MTKIVWCPNCKHGWSCLLNTWTRCECGTVHYVDAALENKDA